MHTLLKVDCFFHAPICIGKFGEQPDVYSSRGIKVRVRTGRKGIALAEEPYGRSRYGDGSGRHLGNCGIIGCGLCPCPRGKVAVQWKRVLKMESVHTDTKNATYDPSRRGESRVLAIRLIGKGSPSITRARAA